MKYPNDTSFENGPYIFASVGVYVAWSNVGFPMIYRSVREFGTIKPEIGFQFVSVNFCARSRVLANEVLEDARANILNGPHTDGA